VLCGRASSTLPKRKLSHAGRALRFCSRSGSATSRFAVKAKRSAAA
jgi:hypothetical protein